MVPHEKIPNTEIPNIFDDSEGELGTFSACNYVWVQVKWVAEFNLTDKSQTIHLGWNGFESLNRSLPRDQLNWSKTRKELLQTWEFCK